MTTRRRLPNRRTHVSFRFRHGVTYYTCGLGFFPDGDVAEIFLNGQKVDSDLDVNARDAAVATSLALQYGASPRALYQSMSRNPDGSPSGPLGFVLGKIIRGEI